MDKQNFLKYLAQTSPDPIGIEVASTEGAWITNTAGRRYLDFIAGIGVANVGHRHPAVLAAIREQLDRHLHVMVYGEYLQSAQIALAAELAAAAPPPLSVTYFTNSGAEAVEGALKTARKFTGRSLFVAFDGSYHGDTMGAMSVMGQKEPRAPYEPLLPARFLPWDDAAALNAIDEQVAAVILEPIQAEGGVRLPSPDFLRRVRARCTAVGALLLADEVVTGFGRTGRLFAVEHWGVVPDLLILAKAMGGGMPLGGFVGRPDVMKTLSVNPPLSHLTTFGGHPVSCAASAAALRVIREEGLVEAAAKTGEQLMKSIAEWRGAGGLQAVRGLGLLIGLEFETAQRCERFVTRCRELGLLLGWTLYNDRVVRLAPPLNLTADELEQGLVIIKKSLEI